MDIVELLVSKRGKPNNGILKLLNRLSRITDGTVNHQEDSFMKNRIKFSMTVFISMIIILAACGSTDEEITTVNSKKEVNDLTVSAIESNSSMDDVESNESDSAEKESKEVKVLSETNEPIQIGSGEEAIKFLKQQLLEGKDDNISFGTNGEIEEDEKGTYYTVQLVDISLRVSGKTGNLGYYKVYQDGTYELYQLSSNTNVSDQSTDDKEKYLSRLREVEKEMETLRKNSDAMTTLDMEKEQVFRYEVWDKELNEIYGVLREKLSKEQADQLRNKQQEWIEYRDETAKEESLTYEGGSKESLHFVATQATLTKEECFELVLDYMN